MFRGFNIGVKAWSLFLVPGVVLVFLLGGVISPMALMFTSSVFLIENKKVLQDKSWRHMLMLWFKAIFFAVFVQGVVFRVARLLAPWIMGSGKSHLSFYILNNLFFVLFSGLYLIWQKVREGRVTKLFNKFDHIRWAQLFSGFFIHTVLMIALVFMGQIIMPIPASTLAIAMAIGLLVTGVQSWFEEVGVRQLPLLFFSDTVKSGKMSQTMANIFFLGISSVIFGMAHFQWFLSEGFLGVLSQMTFGLFTGFMAMNLSGIEFSTGVHAANNVAICVFLASQVVNKAILSTAGFVPFIVVDTVALSASTLVSKYCFSDKKLPVEEVSKQSHSYRPLEASI